MDPSGNSPIEHAQLYDNQAARLRVGSPLLDPELLRSGETTESKNQANGREPVKRLSRDRGLPNQKVVKVESKSSGPFTPTAASADVESTVVPLSQVTIKEAPLPESIEKLKVTKGREDFRKLYTKRGHWNHPDTEYDSSAKLKLTERRALVIAIQYPQGAGGCIRSLPGAFLDGLNVANMLEKQYGYPPHCIRVLADQVNVDNTKDRKRWPTKENIMEGLRWLGEDCPDDSECRRFLCFAGHGYTSGSTQAESVAEGLIPIDCSPVNNFEGSDTVIDPDEVILDWELNNRLVEGLGKKNAKLTASPVILDCCFSGGVARFHPNAVDKTHIRGRHLFLQSRSELKRPNGNSQQYTPGTGNMLDLPVRLGPDLDVIRADEVSGQKDRDEIDDQSQKTCKSFIPFTNSCQVISWFASAAHEYSQEDENGGWFTSAFVKGTKRRGKDQICRYKDLNRSIHNDLSDLNSQPNKKSKEIIEQHPKLYVSPNIANDIAEQIVDM